MKYTRIETGHYVSTCGRIVITKDYSVGYTLKVNNRTLPQMPTTLQEAKSIAEAALRRDSLLKNSPAKILTHDPKANDWRGYN